MSRRLSLVPRVAFVVCLLGIVLGSCGRETTPTAPSTQPAGIQPGASSPGNTLGGRASAVLNALRKKAKTVKCEGRCFVPMVCDAQIEAEDTVQVKGIIPPKAECEYEFTAKPGLIEPGNRGGGPVTSIKKEKPEGACKLLCGVEEGYDISIAYVTPDKKKDKDPE